MGDDVGTVLRDRAAESSALEDVCHVNALQTQPDAMRFRRQHGDRVLKDDGDPVVDGAWGEWLLDLRTPAKRARLAGIVGTGSRGAGPTGSTPSS